MRRFLDYFSLGTEQSTLTNLDFQKLRDKYLIPEEFQLIAPSQGDRVTEPSKNCIAFYDEALLSGL